MSGPLSKYHDKRNFDSTPEPKGSIEKSGKHLRFVVQRHKASRLHYDLRLEAGGVLMSWAVPKGPSLDPSDKRLAIRTEDHPIQYLSFEGKIPKGNYGAGEMDIWDAGTYRLIEPNENVLAEDQIKAEIDSGSLKFVLEGAKLKGEFALVRLKDPKQDNAWLLIKHKDAHAVTPYDSEDHLSKPSQAPLQKTKSNTKNESLTDENAPGTFKPMLAEVKKDAFSHSDWAFEIKWDGYRAIADLRGEPIITSRNGHSLNQKYPKLLSALSSQTHTMVLDGEIIAYNKDGLPDFGILQSVEQDTKHSVYYQVFDLLYLNGHSTLNLSYLQRKELLKDALDAHPLIQYHDHVLEKGKEFFSLAKQKNLEGIIAKHTDSLYSPGQRTGQWLKIKTNETTDVYILGYTKPGAGRQHFGSLLIGQFREGTMEFMGHVGTGFSSSQQKDLKEKMEALAQNEPPVDPAPKTNGTPVWIKPKLLAEIKYTERTKDNKFRHPVFIRIREEFDTLHRGEVKQKKRVPLPKGIKITNPSKVYFPEKAVTKSDLIAFYQSISSYILPHLVQRPQSLNRYPNGINGLNFYQKDTADFAPPWMETARFYSESAEKEIEYILCNNIKTMAYLNNLGCIDFNVWTSKLETIDNPDYLVLDLDPSEGNSFQDVIETALAVKEILDLGEIQGYCKTSGSSGIHIYIPMGAEYNFDHVRHFAHVLMKMVQKKLPTLTTLQRSLSKRDRNKIYLDYLQNRKGQTLSSVYSVRPNAHASVSMPVDWQELTGELRPQDFTIENAKERIEKRGDIFLPVLSQSTDILVALEKLSGNGNTPENK
ncbi:DNA ligase D [Planobacterium oryzisoli]|uniref:DNA ligase (ATP) n=1 Tax=Planobacterium oryzisoli TaxID=2771435 RepID=A0A930YUY3_9FLAO|nr:DNA ligase D [Planobacterium oryzisoli]MBF5026822.1 DNA ligase D [Planobacterium oryzisoli]